MQDATNAFSLHYGEEIILLKYWYQIYLASEEISCFYKNKNLINMTSSLFWNVAQRLLVVSYRRFGKACRTHLQGQAVTSSLSLLYP
jgi:hypothetical protein